VENGRVVQSNFHDYQVLRLNEVPPIDVHVVKSTESPGGMGEIGAAVSGPAVANAVFAATGKRLRRLPLEADLLKA
jgi:CO/xanthine dehydrogenase Mo-binding subunit